MTPLFTLLPLIFGVSSNTTNTLYPTYQYSVHINSESYVSCPTYSGRHLNDTTVYTMYNTIKVNVEGDLYFNNDNDGYYIPSLVISCEYDLFVYNPNDDTYFNSSHYEITLDTLTVTSSSPTFVMSDNYEFVPTFPNTVVVNRVTPLSTTNVTTLQLVNDGLATWVDYTPSVRFGFGDTDIIPQILQIRSLFIANGYSVGFDVGYTSGYSNGYSEGGNYGYQTGYADGLQEGTDRNATATTIFTGILQVGLLPVNVFLAIFNFEVFGINIGGFLASLMTIAIIVIVIRIVVGAKTGS